jgi:hypothetical protein
MALEVCCPASDDLAVGHPWRLPTRDVVRVAVVAALAAGCGGDGGGAPITSAPSSVATTGPTATSSASPMTTSPSTTSSSTTSPSPTTTTNTTVLTTPPPSSAAPGAVLGAILEPYEQRALIESSGYWRSFLDERCWSPPVFRAHDWPPPIDRQLPVGRGAIVECSPTTDPPADTSTLWLIALDDRGTMTTWYEATDGTGVPPLSYERPSGLLCREYLERPSFTNAMANLGEPPWNDDVIAYQFALAYWFMEGEPPRMDVDHDSVPCELLFDPTVIVEVWAGDS